MMRNLFILALGIFLSSTAHADDLDLFLMLHSLETSAPTNQAGAVLARVMGGIELPLRKENPKRVPGSVLKKKLN